MGPKIPRTSILAPPEASIQANQRRIAFNGINWKKVSTDSAYETRGKSNNDVIPGLAHPLSTKFRFPALSIEEKSSITVKRLKIEN